MFSKTKTMPSTKDGCAQMERLKRELSLADAVIIGAGAGRNWWCVLYPKLCFIDATHAVLPDESAKELRFLLSDDDYRAIMDTPGRIHLGLKILDFIK